MGLRTMRYRVGLIGGKLEVGPGPNGGTRSYAGYPPEMRPSIRKQEAKRKLDDGYQGLDCG